MADYPDLKREARRAFQRLFDGQKLSPSQSVIINTMWQNVADNDETGEACIAFVERMGNKINAVKNETFDGELT